MSEFVQKQKLKIVDLLDETSIALDAKKNQPALDAYLNAERAMNEIRLVIFDSIINSDRLTGDPKPKKIRAKRKSLVT